MKTTCQTNIGTTQKLGNSLFSACKYLICMTPASHLGRQMGSKCRTRVVMIINGGRIDGVISDKKLCKIGFPNGYKLLKGDIGIFGKTAEIQAFDFDQGFLREYAKLAVKRDGVVLEVKAKKGSEWLLPQPIRIAQHPTTDTDTAMKGLLKFCDEERAELMNLIIKNRDKPPPSAEGKN